MVLDDAYTFDSRGVFAGMLPGDESTLQFRMDFEDGEWRIATAARRPRSCRAPGPYDHFQQVNVYYLDPTGEILVPEPVLVPRGEQFATALTQSLLPVRGRTLDQVSKQLLPLAATVVLSVTVDASRASPTSRSRATRPG